MAIEQRESIPVIELFGDGTRRELLAAALEEMDTESWDNKSAIKENVSVSAESVRQKFDVLVAFGILEVKDEDARISLYRLADSDAVEKIQSWQGYSLFDLFEYTGAQKLVSFFLTKADPSESYSYNAITKQSDVGYSAASKHMDTLVDAGLVREVEGTRSTEYQLNPSADIYTYLYDLNEALYEAYSSNV